MSTRQPSHVKSTDQQLAPVQPNQAPAVTEPTSGAMTVQNLLGQVSLIQQIMSAAMKDGEHYGKIPGCGDKKTLLKPGAEKLCLTFRLRPTFDVEERNLDAGHREYRVTAKLWSQLTQMEVGEGVGTCLTTESKYRYTKGEGDVTDKPVPKAYWDVRQEDPAKAQELIGGKGFGTKKVDGKGWMITKGGGKVEHTNPADHYNTVLKMAKKRALVDAVLTATAASDIFTQDAEDIAQNLAAAGAAENASHGMAGADSPRGHSSAPALPARQPVPAAADRFEEVPEMTEDEAWETKIHFGKNEGKTLRSLTSNQREYYFDEWPKKTKGNSPADKRLLLAIRTLAPLPSDRDDEADSTAPVRDFRETRVHFGKNRGLMLSELTPQQVHWYETDWMPKKEVNGPTSEEDLLLINSLKQYRNWRGGGRSQSQPRGGQAAAATVEDEAGEPFREPSPDDPDIPF